MKFRRPKCTFFLRLLAVVLTIPSLYVSCSKVEFSSQAPPKVKGSDTPGCGASECSTETEDRTLDITVQSIATKVDILLVVDDSGSMKIDHRMLASRIDGLVTNLNTRGLDWQMCYTTTSASLAGSAQIWLGTSPESYILSSMTPNLNTVFFNSMDQFTGSGSGTEEGILAIGNAVKARTTSNLGCFRADAALASIVLSDEDEASCGGRCQTHEDTVNRPGTDYQRQYVALKPENQPIYLTNLIGQAFPQKPYTGHSIVIRPNDTACYNNQDVSNPAFYGLMYATLSQLTSGILGDICAASSDYDAQLANMATAISNSLSSVTLTCEPIQTPQVSIAMGSYRPAENWSGNKIYFSPPLVAGTRVQVNYTCLLPKN